MWAFLALAVVTVASVNAQSCCVLLPPQRPRGDLTVAEAFTKYRIVGDYLSKPPQDMLTVYLKSDNCNGCKVRPGKIEIYPGKKASPIYTFSNPEIFYPNATEGDSFSVFLLDIDNPSHDESGGKAYIHGLFVNSPGNNLISGDLVVPYVPATPPVGSGEHRYMGLIYKQSEQLDPNTSDMLKLARERHGFSVEDFAKKYNLDGPVAGNFFLSEIHACGMLH